MFSAIWDLLAEKVSEGFAITVNLASATVVPPPPLQVNLNDLVPLVSPERTSSAFVGFLVPEKGAPLAEHD